MRTPSLVGIIPGPGEPNYIMNTYLPPMIKDLQDLWKGVEMKLPTGNKLVRAALLCTGCNIPASKKLCGFRGFGSARGCNRCFKLFEGSGFHKSYADFDRNLWPKCTNLDHHQNAEEIKSATTLDEKERFEVKDGLRYSALIQLPYCDAIRMFSVIDPLHNFYLGTTKHIIILFEDVWLGNESISHQTLESVQSRMASIVCPEDTGRIPSNITSKFGGNQWKNRTKLFSSILTGAHLECWRHFVLASRLLSKANLSTTELLLADALLLQFCRRCVSPYGEVGTPNMHLHAHIREGIKDYGPTPGFWLFAFEQYNGLLGRQPNNHSPKVQIMCRFTRESSLFHIQPSTEFHEQFCSMYPLSNVSDVQTSGSQTISVTHWAQITSSDLTIVKWCIDLTYFKLPTNSR